RQERRRRMRLYPGRTTLSKFLIEHCHTDQRELAALLIDVAAAKGKLGGGYGVAGVMTIQAEDQHSLDVLANELFIDHCEWSGLVAGMLTAENEEPVPVKSELQRGGHLLVFDPLDGSSNIEVNVSVGTVFSVLRYGGSG